MSESDDSTTELEGPELKRQRYEKAIWHLHIARQLLEHGGDKGLAARISDVIRAAEARRRGLRLL